jgi:MFS transporter, ACS family, pantothenate transporter
LEDSEAIPNTITLVSGEVLGKIDRVLLCTGYHMSFPFLRQYHHDFIGSDDADGEVIVTDGTQMHNLHKDIFYIPDTTLAFIGVPYHVATFSLFEYQAIAVAAVFSGKAKLPGWTDMKEEYRQRLSNKGSGKAFHSLKSEEVEYVNSLVEWINRDGKLYGGSPVEGHSQDGNLGRRSY